MLVYIQYCGTNSTAVTFHCILKEILHPNHSSCFLQNCKMILRWRKKTVVHSRAGAAHGRYGHSKQQHDNCINKSSLTTQQRDGLDPSRCVAIWDNGCFHRTALVLFNWFIDAQSATIMSIFLISTEDGMWNAMKIIIFFFF